MSIYDIEQKTKRELVEIVKRQQQHDMDNCKLLDELRQKVEQLTTKLGGCETACEMLHKDKKQLTQRAEQADRLDEVADYAVRQADALLAKLEE